MFFLTGPERIHTRGRLLPLWFFVALFLLPGAAWAVNEVSHTVSYPQDREQIILVRSEFPVSGQVTDLIMPNWTPGSYKIRDYAANVERISVLAEDGTVLPAQKIAKDRWRVSTAQTETLIVDYEVFTPQINVSTSWASRAFTLINGASVFLYTEQSRQLPQLLKVVAGKERGEAHTAMLPVPESGVFKAEDYDELVDNPVVVANAPIYRFAHKQQDYVLLNIGENEFWDGEQATRDIRKIVAETQLFWRTNPLEKPYWFMNFIVEGKGGLEHDHSTVIMTGRQQMRDREKYIKWLSVVTHEFFHVWNVRHMRPVELSEYEYQSEQYTSQLWFAEGLTSYYDNLLMSRAGLINPKEYLDLLAEEIHRLEVTPGRFLRPVTEASLDTWIRQYQSNSNSINSTVSYYTKGAVIGFVLDTYLRKESKGRHNLDEVMREMYARYSSKPHESDAFEKVVMDVAGQEAGNFLHSLLNTTSELDVDAALDWYGLKLDRGVVTTPGESKQGAEPPQSGLGVIWDEGKPGMVVRSVLVGSGGSIAGLMPGDDILAIGDERLSPDRLEELMTSFRPGDETTLLVTRRSRIVELEIKLDTAIPKSFTIGLRSGYKNSHINRLQRWLGQELK